MWCPSDLAELRRNQRAGLLLAGEGTPRNATSTDDGASAMEQLVQPGHSDHYVSAASMGGKPPGDYSPGAAVQQGRYDLMGY